MSTLPWMTERHPRHWWPSDDSTLQRAEETDVVHFSNGEASANTEKGTPGLTWGSQEHLMEEERSLHRAVKNEVAGILAKKVGKGSLGREEHKQRHGGMKESTCD